METAGNTVSEIVPAWKTERLEHDRSVAEAREHRISRSRGRSWDYGIEL
jgi:hypothetical protein